MALEDALYLIGHFRSRATLESTLHKAKVKTRVSRVETLLHFLETSHSSSDPGVKEKSSLLVCGLCTHISTSQPETNQ